VYLSDFEYVAPTPKAGVLSILSGRGEVKGPAGGQPLAPMMESHLAARASLVGINNIPRLDAVRVSRGHLAVQAHARHNDFVDTAVVKVEN